MKIHKENVSRFVFGRTFVACMASTLSIGIANAQEAPVRTQSPEARDGQIEEIVVTANKRSENLQDVPIAITAVTEARLKAVGIANTADLAAVVPGLTLQNSQGGTQAHLRGVGTSAVGPGTENSVATYVDNVYMFSMSGALVQLGNIEQVEVLKGPQGTLFGRNATGGVINIRTRDPKHDVGAQATVGYANYDTVSAQVYLTGGLSETLAADIAGFVSLQGDGWGKNNFTGQDIEKLDQYAVRSKWLFEPGDRDTFRLIGDYSKLKGSQMIGSHITPGASINYGPGTTLAADRPDLAPYIAAGALAPFAVVGDAYPYQGSFFDIAAPQPSISYENWGGSLQWDHEFDNVKLTSITAYRKSLQDVRWAPDPVPALRNVVDYHREERQFSQELQLGSSASSPVQWVVGLYYLDAKAGYDPLTLIGTPLAPLESIRFTTEITGRSGAAFGQITVPLWKGGHVTGGLRYTIEERANSGTTTTTYLAVLPPFLPPALAGTSNTTVVPETAKTFRKLTWRLAIDQQLTPDILGYVSYNRGFKSGTFNAIPPGGAPANPEQLDAWEIGLKTDLFDRRLRLNVAGFYYDYKNIQVTVTRGISTSLENGAGAELYGLDLDLTGKIGSRLTVFGGLSLVDHKFTAYPGAGFIVPQPVASGGGNIKVVGDAKGNKLPYAPNMTFNAGATYTAPIGEGEGDLNVNYSYQGRWYAGPDNIASQSAYGLLDASATYRFPGNRLSIGVWGRNLTDEHYAVFIGASENPGGRSLSTVAAPRTYGIKVGFEF